MAMSVALLGMTSCSEDQLDEVNKNYQYPASDIIPAHLQITDAIMATAFSTSSGDYSFYLSSLTEQQVGTGNNQMTIIDRSSKTIYNKYMMDGIKEAMEELDDFVARPVTAYEDCPEREESR